MKITHTIVCLLCCATFTSCKVIPQEAFLPKEVIIAREEAGIQKGKRGFNMPLVSLGGRLDYSRQGVDEVISLNYDDQKSFREAMVAAVTGLYSWGNVASKKAEEETARVASKEGTKRAADANAADLATLKETNRHTETVLGMEAAPVVSPAP